MRIADDAPIRCSSLERRIKGWRKESMVVGRENMTGGGGKFFKSWYNFTT